MISRYLDSITTYAEIVVDGGSIYDSDEDFEVLDEVPSNVSRAQYGIDSPTVIGSEDVKTSPRYVTRADLTTAC